MHGHGHGPHHGPPPHGPHHGGGGYDPYGPSGGCCCNTF